LTVCEVAEEILTENLGIHHVAAKFMPHLLSEDWKQNDVDVSKELVSRVNADGNF
jgi:hypothetical protein